MPPVQYTGVVMSEPRHRPEPSATVLALRPRENLDFYPTFMFLQPNAARDEIIGRTKTGPDGRFSLLTTGGYATTLFSASADGWQEGSLTRVPRHDAGGQTILLQPAQRAISYTRVALSASQCAGLSSAFGKMVGAYIANRQALSVDAYARTGVLTAAEYRLLSDLRPHLVGTHPDIDMEFSRCVVRIDSWHGPVHFVPQADPYPRAGFPETAP